ncbi:hypothetical protein [Conexibacter sp. CPCC 206217]|uniref:hypothetical protein n=1 Tax=Conexibacter sp. CPCC 206217 TaxID=3064574 RepID=UPI002722EBDB|nr:hypothetical protein [Conexibacter sp. CPCC 206217]MDO8212906.1 hypothetical protein [Conexibacter sp. CPCC 206217]
MSVDFRLGRALLLGALAALAAPSIAAAAPVSTAPPSIRGTLAFGQTVRCDPGQWSGAPTAFTYDWMLNGSSRGSGPTFAIDDPYFTAYPLACQVTATDATGATAVASSAAATPRPGTAKIVVSRFVAQRRGRILATGKITPAAIGRRWDGGSVVLRRNVPGRRDGASFQLSDPTPIRRDGSFKVIGADAPGRWQIRLDFVPAALNLWSTPEVVKRLTISSGGRGCGGCSLTG